MQIYKFFLVRKIPINWYFISGIIELSESLQIATKTLLLLVKKRNNSLFSGFGWGRDRAARQI